MEDGAVGKSETVTMVVVLLSVGAQTVNDMPNFDTPFARGPPAGRGRRALKLPRAKSQSN